MNRATLQSLAALLLLALVLVLVFLPRERAGESPMPSADVNANAAAAPAANAPQASDTASQPTTPVTREVAPDGEYLAGPQAAEETVRVRVVDWEHFKPVADAEVHWASHEWLTERSAFPVVDNGALEALVRTSGLEGRTDERGEIRLPAARVSWLVQASAPGLWGELFVVPQTAQPQELLLGIDGDLRVEVLDARGAPLAGVRVGAARAGDPVGSDPGVKALTGSNGAARLAHARATLLGSSQRGALLVRALTLDPFAPQQVVTVPPWPTELLRLVLREAGEVLVRVVDAQGAPLAEPADVQLSAYADGRPSAVLRIPVVGGEALFRQVPLGARLSCFVFPRAAALWRPGALQGSGPTLAGERVELVIPTGKPAGFVRGRAVGADGAPLANVRLALSLRETSQITFGKAALATRTDGNGMFLVNTSEDLTPASELKHAVVRAPEHGLEGLASFVLVAAQSGVDLGDVRFALPPLLVTGRVVDLLGAPVPGASVRLGHFWALDAPEEPDGLEEALDGHAAMRWEDDGVRSASADASGRFELRAFDASGRYALKCDTPGLARSEWQEFQVGDRDVELVVQREFARLEGRVIAASLGLLARLRVKAGGQDSGVDPAGRFSVYRATADPMDVRIYADGAGPEPLVTIEGVTDATDPRLARIDLRERLVALSFRVVGPTGELVPYLNVKMLSDPAGLWGFDSTGFVTVVAPRGALDVELSAKGLVTSRFDGVREGDVLRLESPPAILARIPEALPAAGAGLEYVLQALAPSGAVRVVLRDGRSARLQLAASGPHSLRWTLHGSPDLLQSTEIVAGKEDLECVLDVQPEIVEAAWAELQARARKSVK